MLLKLTPLVLLVPLVFAVSGRARARLLAGFAAVVLAGYGPLVAAGLSPLGSLPVFLANWRFAGPVHSLGGLFLEAWGQRLMAGAAALLLLVVGAVWERREQRLAVGGLLALSVPLMASPAVFPWYFISLANVAALHSSRLALVGCALWPLTYEVIDGYATGAGWAPSPAVALPLAALAIIAVVLDARWPQGGSPGQAPGDWAKD